MQIYPQWWRKHFLIVEFLIAAVAGAILCLWVRYGDGATALSAAVRNNRGQIYGTLASICGSLLGFAITAMSIVLGFTSSERLTLLRGSGHYSQLWAVFTSTIRCLGLATIAWLLALIFDTEARQRPLLIAVCLFATTLAAFRLSRCIWILERIVEVLTS